MASKNIKKKGQTFSMDVLIVIVFVLFSALFLVLFKINDQENQNIALKVQKANEDSAQIYQELLKEGVIDKNKKLDVGKLSSVDLDELRSKLSIENKVAIVLERDGKLIRINPDADITCIGFSGIEVNGIPCK